MDQNKNKFQYFDAQATWGVTKHMGGMDATDELAELCHISKDQHILEVGCGTGVTACHLVKQYGCRVTAVDVSEKMIEWAKKRIRRKGLEDQIEFKTADAVSLPFEDAFFDAVICESVTAFPKDKQKAVDEYARVIKAGGYVGINEGTWIKTPPPEELVDYAYRTMAGAQFLPTAGWKTLLATAGMTDIDARTYELNAFSQRLNELRGLDWQDRLDRLRGVRDFIKLYMKSPEFRSYAKEITPSMKIIKNLFEFLGYGLYVGTKQNSSQGGS